MYPTAISVCYTVVEVEDVPEEPGKFVAGGQLMRNKLYRSTDESRSIMTNNETSVVCLGTQGNNGRFRTIITKDGNNTKTFYVIYYHRTRTK